MRKLSESEMKHVLGGQFIRDCRDTLQKEADDFKQERHTMDEANKFYDEWSQKWEDCLRSLGML